MKKISLLLLGFVVTACSTFTTPQSSTTAEVQKQVLYSGKDLKSDIQAQIPDFPKAGSEAQSKDEKVLRSLQKSRTAEDCKRAESEVIVNLENFYGEPYGELTEAQVNLIDPLIRQVQYEYGANIGFAKRAYPRPRPYEYIKGLKPCLQKETSMAYPSGHATLAYLYGFILADVMPEKADKWKERAQVIAKDRVIGGVHHPSDIEAGQKLGEIIYSDLKKSARYQADVEKLKNAVHALP